MSDGGITWKLNGDQSVIVFRQTLGEELYPSFYGKQVYYDNGCYTNDDPTTSVSLPEKRADDTIIYDMYGRAVSTPRQGIYIINGKKYWFE